MMIFITVSLDFVCIIFFLTEEKPIVIAIFMKISNSMHMHYSRKNGCLWLLGCGLRQTLDLELPSKHTTIHVIVMSLVFNA